MIGIINGVVEYKEDPFLIIDVNGVGYKVLVPTAIFTTNTGLGERIKLFTHTHVREDLLELYGFSTPEDLKLFVYLISVSGVGCRTALNIFSIGSRREIIHAITSGNTEFFTAVPRLGKKNSQKIIIELKNKLGGGDDLDLSDSTESEHNEIIAVLKTFGFTVTEAQAAIKALKGKGE